MRKQGTHVSFDNGVIKGTGTIMGYSTDMSEKISYIIEPSNSIMGYPYTHIVLEEVHVKDKEYYHDEDKNDGFPEEFYGGRKI